MGGRTAASSPHLYNYWQKLEVPSAGVKATSPIRTLVWAALRGALGAGTVDVT